jgi:hypothetical protein
VPQSYGVGLAFGPVTALIAAALAFFVTFRWIIRYGSSLDAKD